jgi:hypothetical protein
MRSYFTLAYSVRLLCGAGSLPAQVSAVLSGTVSDPSGGVVAAAVVTAKNTDTGLHRATVTDAAGLYRIPSLPVGEYEIRAAKPGFTVEVRTGIHLVVGQDATVDLTLRVGESRQQVTVNADAALVDVTTQDIAGLVDECQIRDLPLNGRGYDELLTLNPGVVNFTWEKTGGIGVSNSTAGNNFAVDGNRPQQNLFLLNGVEFTGAAENNMQPGGFSQELLGVDAVREFNMLRDSYGAEYGKRPGAQVLIVTQSGSNQWHGSIYAKRCSLPFYPRSGQTCFGNDSISRQCRVYESAIAEKRTTSHDLSQAALGPMHQPRRDGFSGKVVHRETL